MTLVRTAILLFLVALPACSETGVDQTQGPAEPESSPRAESAPATSPAATAASPAWFQREDESRGLTFTHVSGHDRTTFLMPESISGGAALFDMDGDGDLDAYLVQQGAIRASPADRPRNRLFRNDGAGRFTDVTDASGAGDQGLGMGAAVGDYDNDGDEDLYVTNLGANVLLRNEGNGTFTDVTSASRTGDRGWGTSAAFVDADRDGDLDLFVCNYVNWTLDAEITCYNAMGRADYCMPTNYNAPSRASFYRNNGDGTFADATEASGIGARTGTGLGVLPMDALSDGWPDLVVANDAMKDCFWMNQTNGSFVDRALPMGCAVNMDGKATASMGLTGADLDTDGDEDYYVGNLAGETDALFRNDGGVMTDVSGSLGIAAVTRSFTRFGTGFHDFDLDGIHDLYVANGRVLRQAQTHSDDPYAEPNVLLRGEPGPRFREVLPRGGTSEVLVATSRAAAFGDVDNDGDVDVLVVNRDGPAHLLMNVAPRRGHWCTLTVRERHGRHALGAVITVTAGEREIRHEVRAAYSYLASNDPRVQLGLGQCSRLERVLVRWPTGEQESFGPFEADAAHEIRQGAGTTQH